MQHPNFETRHPLQTDEHQETGFDPLNNFNKNRSRGSLDSSTFSQSQSTFLSYRKEWDDLFLNSNYLARIRQAGINGRLRSSRFRSVCWKLYLEALPEERSQWINKTKEHRAHYEKIKETHITNPRKAGQQDLVVNNPLSQDEGSLWNRFFQDKELKGMIKQDVLRTFPEIRYFQDDDVRTKLTDILFCYARENEQLLYKQGMHELLAPIVFVLHCDHQAFQHASETASPSEEMKCLLNPEYLEHDAYALFSHLMETAEPWFSSYEREVRKGKDEMLTSIPFARPQDSGPSVAIVTKVNRIQDLLLKKNDVELHMHLNRLEIAPQIYGIRWVRLLFGREFPLQDLLVVWDALFADSITLDLVDYCFVAMLLYIRDALIASNFQTCLGLLMHYPPLGDINSLLQKALFLRDPKNYPRPVNYQFQQNLDYYKTRGADLMNKTRSGSSTKPAPLNINKVSSSLLNFGRKLIAPAISGGSASISPINSSEVHSSSSSSSSTSPASAPAPALSHPLAEAPSGQAPPQTQSHAQTQHYRLLKSESMPVHLSKGQSSMTVSSSPSIESLPGGRPPSAASPPLPPFRGGDVSTSSPPLSATKKESFFNITRSRSHSKSMGKKESEEDLEGQVSFLQGQINDLEAMSKYCARMMNAHICNIQEVILQEHLQKEDEVLVSLAGLKQIKDILKGSLRFNQSQLEAEENEEIAIADDHYTSTAAAESARSANNLRRDHRHHLQQANSRRSRDSDLDGRIVSTDEKGEDPQGEDQQQQQQEEEVEEVEEQQEMAPPEQQVAPRLGSEGKNWDDYILVQPAAERTALIRRGLGPVRTEPEGAAGTFHDPLMAGAASSGSSSPDEGSTHSKDSDFTIVNPNDL
uniref:TBC1 domain family member 5 n=1 Tax=Gasterosteus aculeatus aculeatus TaxID=481459 RepID=A0AAQ4RRL1_GASAC|nr:TBC1 domain family member 5 isoform X1 [Gasterosteus aculeatus aculeatus]XP_040044012.1 TBC1 domain family member 5 isoform X1 [Gasterosteus aculeatus aculeatus]